MCGTTISVEIKELLEFVYAISSQLALSGNPVELAYRLKTLMKQPFFFYKKNEYASRVEKLKVFSLGLISDNDFNFHLVNQTLSESSTVVENPSVVEKPPTKSYIDVGTQTQEVDEKGKATANSVFESGFDYTIYYFFKLFF
jgi:hypothetical protein